MFKKIILYIWQLPQNILGLLVILFSGGKKVLYKNVKKLQYFETKFRFGVSLGEYRIIHKNCQSFAVFHEYGHTRQSRMLGPLYLIIIGLPSLIGNIFDRLAHKKWSYERRNKWYYNQPWEKWANNLANKEKENLLKNIRI